jgi:RNase P subunit RPR2
MKDSTEKTLEERVQSLYKESTATMEIVLKLVMKYEKEMDIISLITELQTKETVKLRDKVKKLESQVAVLTGENN